MRAMACVASPVKTSTVASTRWNVSRCNLVGVPAEMEWENDGKCECTLRGREQRAKDLGLCIQSQCSPSSVSAGAFRSTARNRPL